MVRPDPIPNSAVKHSLADGSGLIDSARVGCRHSFNKKPENIFSGFFAFRRLTTQIMGLMRHMIGGETWSLAAKIIQSFVKFISLAIE